jgi:hypothetical protein
MNGISGSLGCNLLGKCGYNAVAGEISYLYRSMNAAPDNPETPLLRSNAKGLGARVPRDYNPSDDDLVYPQSNGPASGLSTNLTQEGAANIQQITGASDIWRIPASNVPSEFQLTPDPTNSNHITWDVEEPMPVEAINSAIQGTQPYWERVVEDGGDDF